MLAGPAFMCPSAYPRSVRIRDLQEGNRFKFVHPQASNQRPENLALSVHALGSGNSLDRKISCKVG